MKTRTILYSAFKELLLFSIAFWSILVSGQETKTEEEKSNYNNRKVKLRTGLVFPSANGNNFLAENYDIKTGFYVDLALNIDKKRDLAIQLQGIQGIVTETENLSLVESSTIRYGFIVFGQSLLNHRSNFRINANLGLGYVNFRNRVGLRRFTDSGLALMAGLETSYRLNKTIGFYFSIQNQWGFLNINAPSTQRRFLRNTQTLAPSAGIKFYIL